MEEFRFDDSFSDSRKKPDGSEMSSQRPHHDRNQSLPTTAIVRDPSAPTAGARPTRAATVSRPAARANLTAPIGQLPTTTPIAPPINRLRQLKVPQPPALVAPQLMPLAPLSTTQSESNVPNHNPADLYGGQQNASHSMPAGMPEAGSGATPTPESDMHSVTVVIPESNVISPVSPLSRAGSLQASRQMTEEALLPAAASSSAIPPEADPQTSIAIPSLEAMESLSAMGMSGQPLPPMPERQNAAMKSKSDPKTPAEYAFHVLFTQFVRDAERKLNLCASYSYNAEPDVTSILGEGVDPSFDKIIASFGGVARRKPKAVFDSVKMWQEARIDQARTSGMAVEQNKLISTYLLYRVLMEVVKQCPPNVLGEEATEKLEDTCFKHLRTADPRTLSQSILQQANWDLVAKIVGEMSEERFVSVGDRFIAEFEKFPASITRDSDTAYMALIIRGMRYLRLKIYPIDALEESAEFLDSLVKFFSQTFVGSGSSSSTVSGAIGNSLGSGSSAMGSRNIIVKEEYAQALSQILLPLSGFASAELNHPMWISSIEKLFAKAELMARKPKYWAVAYELSSVVLSVAPQQLFLANWVHIIEGNLSKIKEKSRANRAVFYVGAVRLLWVFVFRWTESLNSTTKKLDEVCKALLFNNSSNQSGSSARKQWLSVDPAVSCACAYMIRIGAHGYLEYVLESVLPQMLWGGASTTKNVSAMYLDNIVPERASVAIRAFVQILHDFAGGSSSPVKKPGFPNEEVLEELGAYPRSYSRGRSAFQPSSPRSSSPSLSRSSRAIPQLPDYLVPPMLEPKQLPNPAGSLGQFYDTFCKAILRLAVMYDAQFGAHVAMPDEKPIQLKPTVSFSFGSDNSSSQAQRQASIELFIVVLQTLPWCMGEVPGGSTYPGGSSQGSPHLAKAVEILSRNVTHSITSIAQVSIRSLKYLARIADTRAVLNVYTKLMFAFDEKMFTSSDCPPSKTSEFERLLRLYLSLIVIWIDKVNRMSPKEHQPASSESTLRVDIPASSDDTSTLASGRNEHSMSALWGAVEEIEGNGLFFLCSQDRTVRSLAVRILQLTVDFDKAICSYGVSLSSKGGNHSRKPSKSDLTPPSRLIQFMETAEVTSLLEAFKPQVSLSMPERSRLAKLHTKKRDDNLAALTESDYGVDTALWIKAFPSFIKKCFESYPMPVAICRNIVCIRLVRMYDVVVDFARQESSISVASKAFILKHPMRTHPEVVVEQWRIYLMVACSTLTLTDEQKLHIPDNSQYQHGRKKSAQKITIHHQRITSVRSVFRMVIPLLGVDHPVIRDAIVSGITCINVNIYKTLLECLHPVIESWKEDSLSGSSTAAWMLTGQGSSGITRRDAAALNASAAVRQDRLITEAAHLLKVTVHYLEVPEIADDEWIVAELVGFLNSLRSFLSLQHVQLTYSFQKLRRYFCGLLEGVYLAVGLSSKRNSPISFESRLRFFLLIDEWSPVGENWMLAREREAQMKRTVLTSTKDMGDHNIVVASMELEKKKFDNSIYSSLAALCCGPMVQPADASGRRKSNTSFNVPVVLKWIAAMFDSSNDDMHVYGRKALKNLLKANPDLPTIFQEAVASGYTEHSKPKASKSYFVALAELLLEVPDYPCNMRQLLALGLFKTGDEDLSVRSLAVDLLKATELRFYGETCLMEYQVTITNRTRAVYKRAMFNLSTRFATDHPEEAYYVFSELTKYFNVVNDMSRRDILAVLLPWIQTVELQVDVTDLPSPSTSMVLANLFEITINFSDRIQNEVEALWVALGNGMYPGNVKVVMDFVFHHSLERRDPAFVELSRKILLYLSNTPAGGELVDFLLAYLTPKNMITAHPEPYDTTIAESVFPYIANISTILPPNHSKEVSFSRGQLAMIMLVDLLSTPRESVRPRLPLILHVVLSLFDQYMPIVRDRARELLIHIIYQFAGPSLPHNVQALKLCESLKKKRQPQGPFGMSNASSSQLSWAYDDLNSERNGGQGGRVPKPMVQLVQDILGVIRGDSTKETDENEPAEMDLWPGLQEQWAREALLWATTCPVRHIACRSYQIFRCLLSSIDLGMLSDMLSRLSNTISDPKTDIQEFAMQILMTLNAITAELDPQELINYPQLFWTSVGCLGTPVEQEFIEVLSILGKFISKIDLDSPETVAALMAVFPPRWNTPSGGKHFSGLQQALIPGLRSCLAWEQTHQLLDRLNLLQGSEIIAGPDRLALAIASSLPRFLHSFDSGEVSPELEAVALRLRDMCDAEGEQFVGLSRILTSFAKSRFRAKQDFLTQSVNSLFTNFFPQCQLSVLHFLLGILPNKIRWVKKEVMNILKALLPMVDLQQEEFSGVGADFISPLLRLLRTDYAEQAMRVLDEMVSIPAGAMDGPVLRMSMGTDYLRGEFEKTATLFGIPEESGWAIPMPAIATAMTRNNVHSVLYTCNSSYGTDAPEVETSGGAVVDEFQFHKEEYGGYFGPMLDRMDSISVVEELEGPPGGVNGSMSTMWTALDNLDSFFTRDMKRTRVNERGRHRGMRDGRMGSSDGGGSIDIGGGHWNGRSDSNVASVRAYMAESEGRGRDHHSRGYGRHMHDDLDTRHHQHNTSVTDTDMSTDNAIDPIESVPQLYDKKVSLILNRSLARTPSTTSFKTTLGDSFGNSPATPAFGGLTSEASNSSLRTIYTGGSALARRREIVEFGHSRSDSSSNGSGTQLSLDDEATHRKMSSSATEEYAYHGAIQGLGVRQEDTPVSPTSLSNKRDKVSPKPAKSAAPNEGTFRLESLLRGASNIRKGKKKPKATNEASGEEGRRDSKELKERKKEKERSKERSRSHNGRLSSSSGLYGRKSPSFPSPTSTSTKGSGVRYQFPPQR